MLEPYDGKLSRTVLRGEGGRKAPDLPGAALHAEGPETLWDNGDGETAMNATVEALLDSFKALPEEEKHQLASEILRWSRHADHPPLADEELAAAADEVFLGLDHDEKQHG